MAELRAAVAIHMKLPRHAFIRRESQPHTQPLSLSRARTGHDTLTRGLPELLQHPTSAWTRRRGQLCGHVRDTWLPDQPSLLFAREFRDELCQLDRVSAIDFPDLRAALDEEEERL